MYDYQKILSPDFILQVESLLEKFQPPKHYEKDQYIFRQGETAHCFYFLKSGIVKTFILSPDGDERIIFVLKEKGIFAVPSFFSGALRPSSAIALEDCQIIPITQKTFDACLSIEPRFAISIMQDLCKDIELMLGQITATTFYTAPQKVAIFLLHAIQTHDEVPPCLTLTHEAIAKSIGVSRPTVNKILKHFAKQGLLSTQYGKILIHKPEGLQAVIYV